MTGENKDNSVNDNLSTMLTSLDVKLDDIRKDLGKQKDAFANHRVVVEGIRNSTSFTVKKTAELESEFKITGKVESSTVSPSLK